MDDPESMAARGAEGFVALERAAARAGRAMAAALLEGQTEGRRLEGVLRSLVLSLAEMATRAAARPLTQLIAAGVGALAEGARLDAPPVGRAAAPAMPEARAAQPAAALPAVHVTITTPDIESFRRAEAQVAGDLARAVARGQRSL